MGVPAALASYESMPVVSQPQARLSGDGARGERQVAGGSISQPASRGVQSFDYLWRSGVAGGTAGCVVGFFFFFNTGMIKKIKEI